MSSGAAQLELDADIPAAHQHPAWTTLKRLLHHRSFLFGLGLFGIVLLAAALAPWIAPVDPTKLAMRFKFRPPGSEFAFGTDNFGRSLWSRVIWGAQLSVIIGFSVVALNAVFGTLIGALAGYFRTLDNGLMRINDAMMAFPAILLAIGITAVLGPSTLNAILRFGNRLHPAHGAYRALLGHRAARDGICAGGDRGRRGALAYPAPPHPAQRDGAADRATQLSCSPTQCSRRRR